MKCACACVIEYQPKCCILLQSSLVSTVGIVACHFKTEFIEVAPMWQVLLIRRQSSTNRSLKKVRFTPWWKWHFCLAKFWSWPCQRKSAKSTNFRLMEMCVDLETSCVAPQHCIMSKLLWIRRSLGRFQRMMNTATTTVEGQTHRRSLV